MTSAMIDHPVPSRVDRLPRDRIGRPIPWFVATLEGGIRDFRIASQENMVRAIRERLCWVCGQVLGVSMAFTIGPMCAINRISSEPPAHLECADYSVKVCPFLSTPGMRRRTGGKPQDETVPAAGDMIERNPGVALIWVTRSYEARRVPVGNDGILFHMGDPERTLWFREGRPAGTDEILESIASGLPELQKACDLDDDPQQSRMDLAEDVARALLLVPAWQPRTRTEGTGG